MRANHKPAFRIRGSIAAAVASLLLCACGVDSSYTNTNLGSVSIGQQLIDLKAAQDNGLLSEQEYRTLRVKLLRALARSLDTNTDADTDNDALDDEPEEDDDYSWLF